MSATATNHKVYKEIGKGGPFKEENKLAEAIPKEAEALNILDKDLKTAVLSMFKELRQNTDKKLMEIRKNNTQTKWEYQCHFPYSYMFL